MPQIVRPSTIPVAAETASPPPADARPTAPVILACIDRSRPGREVLRRAALLASAVGGRLVLMRVLDAQPGNDLPPDPVDWDLRRHEAACALAALAERGGVQAEIALAQGRPADEICDEAIRRDAEYVVLGRFGEGFEDMGRVAGLGATARSVLERAQEKVLLIAEGAAMAQEVGRILVPLDGSCWAESALPTALRLARATGAEVVLAHIVTSPEFVCPAPPEPDDMELLQRIIDRNTRVARGYLERQRTVLAEHGVVVRTRIIVGADARDRLLDLLRDEAFDLVVLSARGSGFRHLPGPDLGSVTAHLSLHSPTPLLVVRSDTDAARRRREQRAHATASPDAAADT